MPNATGLALAVDKGANVVAVAVGGDNQPYHLITGPAVKTFKDLKGKTNALADPTDIYTTVIKTILKKNGLNPDTNINFLYGPSQNQRYPAIISVFPNDGCVTRRGLDGDLEILHEQGRLTTLSASDGLKLMDRQWCPKG